MDFKTCRRIEENILLKTKEEQIELAYEFSEGNKSLEDLLLFLWNKGIATYFCCGGHHDNNCPYIGIDATNFTKKEKDKIFIKLKGSNRCYERTFSLPMSEEEYYAAQELALEKKIIDKRTPYKEYLEIFDENKLKVYLKRDKKHYQPNFSFIKDIINEVKFGVVKNKINNNPLEK